MVRPFESQHKDVYNSGYESYEMFKIPIMCKNQTPQRKTQNQPASDEEQQEMIIPKDFSNQKFRPDNLKSNKVKQQMMGSQNNVSSFGSIIGGDSQLEPQEVSNNIVTHRSASDHSRNQHQ